MDLPSGLQLTALDPDYRKDPYGRLAQLRQECPVRRDPVFGSVYLTAYAEVRSVLTDLSLWRDPIRAADTSMMHQRAVLERGADGSGRPQSILTSDDPDHGRVRGLITPILYRRFAASRDMVERVVKVRLDAFDGQDEVDLISAFAAPIPIEVIAHLLGVDPARLEEFRSWSEAIIQTFNPARTSAQSKALQDAAEASLDYLLELMGERRRTPKDDLVSDLVALQAEGATISDDEIRINCNTLLIAGNLTTTDLIGNGARLLMTHPEELAKLRSRPDLISSVVEEVLRFEPPVDSTLRIASRPMQVRECPVVPRDPFTASLRAANRDPDVFKDPDRFDVTRERVAHVAFGGGAHICLGAPLARIEAQAALGQLFARHPDLRLLDPEPEWRPLPFFRGLEKLPVDLGRGARG